MRQRHGAPAAKRGMDERWLGGSAPDNCLITASEQYDVVSHRRRFLPLPWPLFGATFFLWALSGVPPTGVTGEHGHNGLRMPQSTLKRVRAIWALVSGPKLTKRLIRI